MIHFRVFTGALFLFATLLVVTCSFGAASDDGKEPSWRLFKSQAGRFSVEMPGTPAEKETQRKSFIGTITSRLFLAKDQNGEYTVTYSDLPRFAVSFAGHNTVFSHAKGALLMETLGKEQSYEDATLNSIRGKRLVYDLPDPAGTGTDMRGEAYFFLVARRLYVIDANVPLGRTRTDANHFLSTFKIEQK